MVIIMIAQIIVSLSIIVILHELGHFLPAKWFKTKVEKFYLFFNPGFALVKKKIGETEYGIGWLPLGGYVKIAGMIDESFDRDQMKEEPKPWEFRSKPAWQRLIIMTGGVIVNFILGAFIFAMMLWHYGEQYIPNDQIVYGIQVDSLAQSYGFKDGDRIVKVNGKEFTEFNSALLRKEMLFEDNAQVEVLRNGRKEILSFEGMDLGQLASYKGDFMRARVPFIVDTMVADGPAFDAGILKDDQIISVDSIPTPYYNDYSKVVSGKKNELIRLGVLRGVDTLEVPLTLNEDGRMGVWAKMEWTFFNPERKKYSLLESLPKGCVKAVTTITDQIKAFGLLFSGALPLKENLAGPVGMAQLYGYEWNWARFWNITAVISLVVGFINILPIPGLDGGYVMALFFEMITGKKPSDKVMERLVTFGFIFLMTLFVLVTCNDITKLLG